MTYYYDKYLGDIRQYPQNDWYEPITNNIFNIIIEEAQALRFVRTRISNNALFVEHDTCVISFSDTKIVIRTMYPGTDKLSDWHTLQYSQYANLRDLIIRYSSGVVSI